MLSQLIINSIDVINIVLLFNYFTKKDREIIKLTSSIFIISILITLSDYMNLNFIIQYIITILVIKVIFIDTLKDTILVISMVVIIDMFL